MRVPKLLTSIFILAASVLLMGQTQNCSDLSKIMDQISNALNGGPGGGSKVYIANLSFLDVKSQSILVAGDADLINKVVEEGMNTVAQQDKRYVVNDPSRTLKNNDANAQNLNKIFFDPNLSRTEKIDKIVSDLMTPNKVDGLVTGQYTENSDGSLSVRPFAISAKDKKFVTESLVFKRDEFKCADPQAPTTSILCDKAKTDIHDAIVRMIKSL
jgi:hypothetical protein